MTDPAADAGARVELTDNEGSLLTLVLREQPITGYQIIKLYEQSPASNFNESKGAVYPLIARLKARNLIDAENTASRNARVLRCTPKGEIAAKSWVARVDRAHILPNDPLRTKALSLHLLTRQEQIDWVLATKEAVCLKEKEIEDYHASRSLPNDAVVYANSMGHLRLRMDWLDRVLRAVLKNEIASADEG